MSISSKLPEASTSCSWSVCQSQSHITTDSLSASLSWYQAPTWDPRPIFPILDFLLPVSGLLMWGALSDEKSGLYFSVFAGHSQCSLSQILVPWDSWAQFIVSIFETPPTRKGQVPVFISPRNRVARLYPRALGLTDQFTYYYMLYL
jgi:hypothetical protein